MLGNVLDAVLGTTTKVRILRSLLPLTSPVSGTEARRLARVRSVKAMWASLEELTELGILARDQTPGTHLYRINRENHLVPALATLFEVEQTRWSELRDALRAALESSGLLAEVRSAVLYGSNARGEAEAGSDLDLLVVTRSAEGVTPVRDKLLSSGSEIATRLGPHLSPYVLPEGRVRERCEEDDPLMRTIVSEGRDLFGMPFRQLVGAE